MRLLPRYSSGAVAQPDSKRLLEPDTSAAGDESRLLADLRAGSEPAFTTLVARYSPSMLRVARLYGADPALAEEIVQETWIQVLQGLARFEGRSSLRTWIFVILGNAARKRTMRESRLVPQGDSSDLVDASPPAGEHDRFFPPAHPRWAGAWTTLVDDWESVPDRQLLSDEALRHFRSAVEELPTRTAAVVTLRDIEGWSSEEVCTLLGITQANQRVLLHRGRARIRAALEGYLGGSR